jgi:hypothetical protein
LTAGVPGLVTAVVTEAVGFVTCWARTEAVLGLAGVVVLLSIVTVDKADFAGEVVAG